MSLEEENEYLKAKIALMEELHKMTYWHYP
jgi:hypothetical protein